MAVSPDGKPLFKGSARDGSAAPVATAGPSPVTPVQGGSVTFDVPPGPLQLRLSVQNASGHVLDAATQEVDVPDYTAIAVTLGTPRFYRGRTVRELQAIRDMPSAPPVVDREFSRSERLLLRVEANAPGGLAPDVTAKLMNRGGASMSEIKMQLVGGLYETELPLSSLAAGEYLVELTAKGLAGTAQDTVAFRIGR